MKLVDSQVVTLFGVVNLTTLDGSGEELLAVALEVELAFDAPESEVAPEVGDEVGVGSEFVDDNEAEALDVAGKLEDVSLDDLSSSSPPPSCFAIAAPSAPSTTRKSTGFIKLKGTQYTAP